MLTFCQETFLQAGALNLSLWVLAIVMAIAAGLKRSTGNARQRRVRKHLLILLALLCLVYGSLVFAHGTIRFNHLYGHAEDKPEELANAFRGLARGVWTLAIFSLPPTAIALWISLAHLKRVLSRRSPEAGRG